MLDQCGSSDMIQSKLANQKVTPNASRKTTEIRAFLDVAAGSRVSSCCRDVLRMALVKSNHIAT